MTRKVNRQTKAASPPSKQSASIRGGTILGVFVGMILGAIIVAAAVWFFFAQGDPTKQQKERAAATTAAPGAQPAPPSSTTTPPQTPALVPALPGKPGDRPVERPDFTFFNALPSGEQPKVAASPAQQPPLERQTYLQLAAFENATQADDLRVRLVLMGLDPIIQRVQLNDGRVVHRIRIGPFTDREDLKAMRARLSSGGFSAEEVSN